MAESREKVLDEFFNAEKKVFQMLAARVGNVSKESVASNTNEPEVPLVHLERRDKETVLVLFYVFLGIVILAAFIIFINCLTSLCYVCQRVEEGEPIPPDHNQPDEEQLEQQPLPPRRQRELGMTMKPSLGFRTHSSNHTRADNRLQNIKVDARRPSAVAPIAPKPSKTSRKSKKSGGLTNV